MVSERKINRLAIAAFGLILILTLPLTGLAQGRGHGRGRGPDLGKKCSKFVNCHDASEGRLDGRGPRRDSIFRNGIVIRRGRDRRIHDKSLGQNSFFRGRGLRRGKH
jgi:hypothetical protein